MTDLVILEFLSKNDLELAPKPLYRNLNRHGHDIGYSTVRGRLPELAEKGVLERDVDGHYDTFNRSFAYFAAEIDSDHLDDFDHNRCQ